MTIEQFSPKEWFVISKTERMVARLPPGKSGIQALKEWLDADWATRHPYAPPVRKWRQLQNGEGEAGDYYLRCCSPMSDRRTLTAIEWKDFRKLGGTTYDRFVKGLRAAVPNVLGEGHGEVEKGHEEASVEEDH